MCALLLRERDLLLAPFCHESFDRLDSVGAASIMYRHKQVYVGICVVYIVATVDTFYGHLKHALKSLGAIILFL